MSAQSSSVGKCIQQAYRLAGILAGPNQSISPDELDEGLDVLNTMLDSWNTESLLAFRTPRTEFPTVANQAVYEIGAGAQFDTDRPLKVDFASILLTGTYPQELPLIVLRTVEEWRMLAKSTLS